MLLLPLFDICVSSSMCYKKRSNNNEQQYTYTCLLGLDSAIKRGLHCDNDMFSNTVMYLIQITIIS